MYETYDGYISKSPAIHIAIRYNYIEIAYLWLEYGADINSE